MVSIMDNLFCISKDIHKINNIQQMADCLRPIQCDLKGYTRIPANVLRGGALDFMYG